MTANHVRPHAFTIELFDDTSTHPFFARDKAERTQMSEQVSRLVVTTEGMILWDGGPITGGQLISLLEELQASPDDIALEIEPEDSASYDLVAKVLNLVVQSGTPFRLAGLEQHCEFSPSTRAYPSSARRGGSGVLAHTVFHVPNDQLLAQAQMYKPCEPIPAIHDPDD